MFLKDNLSKPYPFRLLKPPNPRVLYFYCLLLGGFTGLIAVAFTYALAYVEVFLLTYLAGVHLSHPDNEFAVKGVESPFSHPYLIIVIPALGAFISGVLTYCFSPKSSGIGTEAVIKSFHEEEGKLPPSTPLIKFLATIFTLGSGGSAGKEGPMALIGSGFGSIMANGLKLGARGRRALLLAGTAGGLGALFKAPLGGAMTAIEIIYKEDFETDSLIPCILSSATGYIVYCSFFGFDRLFNISPVYFNHHIELLFYFILGIVCVFLGRQYINIFNFLKYQVFDPMPVHPIIKPVIGGLLVGIIGLICPEAIGSGFGFLQDVLADRLPNNTKELFQLFLIIACLKMLSSSLTLSSYGSGGFFGPSLVIGALLGGCVGAIASMLFPESFSSHIPYVIVGMAAFFAGVANAPIATLIMVCEITGGYNLLLPLLMVSMITIIFSSKSIYTNQPQNKFSTPAHVWDMNVDLLKHINIGDIKESLIPIDAPNSGIITDDTSFEAMHALALDSKSHDFIIKNHNNIYLGSASLSRVDSKINLGLLAYDFMEEKRTVTLNDDLSTAVENMLYDDMDKIAVLEGKKIVACLPYKTVMHIYKNEIFKFAQLKKKMAE